MKAVLSWIKSHGAVHLLIVAIFTLPVIWILTVVPNRDQPRASRLRLWLDRLEYQTIDTRMYYGRKAKIDPSLVLLAIDAPSIKLDSLPDADIQASPVLSEMKASGYPYPRDVYAQICDRLFSAGAKVVAFDLLLLNPKPDDVRLAQALDTYRDKVVLAEHFTTDATGLDLPADSLIPSGDPLDGRLGYVNFWPDYDGVVRNATYRTNLEEMSNLANAGGQPKLYSFAARIVQRSGHAELVPDDFRSRPLRFARGAARGTTAVPPFPTFSLIDIFDSASWNSTFQHGDFFRDKIVVVGPTDSLFQDVHSTPAGDLSGAEVHLNAVNALLQNEFLTPFSPKVGIGIVLLSAAVALLLALLIHSIGLRFGIALVLDGVYAVIVMWAYDGPGWLLPVVAPTVVFSGSVAVGFVYDFVVSQLERYRLRLTLERYSSKNVVKYLLSHPDSYKEMLVGTRRDVSVLFSDIRGFTTIVETAPDSRELVRKLNEYLAAMVDCVIKQDGNLEKFMGDGIMAVWGNTPYSAGPKDDAIRAVRAALAMTVELKRLNAKWVSEGRSEWRIGIGVNHGSVIVGDMGSPEHKEFAMVGDPVNLGSRLEGLTKEFHVQIMIGEMAADLVRDVFYLRTVGVVKVMGKTRAVKTFTVLGERKDGLPPGQESLLQLHEQAMAAFFARDFAQAGQLFGQILQGDPEDYLAQTYLESASQYAKFPPPPDWDGVRVMTKK